MTLDQIAEIQRRLEETPNMTFAKAYLQGFRVGAHTALDALGEVVQGTVIQAKVDLESEINDEAAQIEELSEFQEFLEFGMINKKKYYEDLKNYLLQKDISGLKYLENAVEAYKRETSPTLLKNHNTYQELISNFNRQELLLKEALETFTREKDSEAVVEIISRGLEALETWKKDLEHFYEN